MNDAQQLPSHPYWEYSIRLYARPGVNEACLKLQDEFDLDVNMVLFCLWAGAMGPGELTADELQQAAALGAVWQREVVKPLRQIRRKLKTDTLGISEAARDVFRPKVQSLEIDAEHAEQLMLADLVPLERGESGINLAVANCFAYMKNAGLAPAAPGDLRETVMIILQQAFPDATAAQLESYWPL